MQKEFLHMPLEKLNGDNTPNTEQTNPSKLFAVGLYDQGPRNTLNNSLLSAPLSPEEHMNQSNSATKKAQEIYTSALQNVQEKLHAAQTYSAFADADPANKELQGCTQRCT
jgi:hypothetical protein